MPQVPQPILPPAVRELRPGLICNPEAGRNRRQLDRIRTLAHALPLTAYLEAVTATEIAAAIDDMAAADINLLMINGGDGSVQALLTHLVLRRPFRYMPLVLLIPGGTTNMTALDIGIRGGPVQVLQRVARLLAAPEQVLDLRQRPVLQITHADQPPVCGMFFGAGVIAAGVQYHRDRIHGYGMIGEKASALALGRVLLALAGWRREELMAPAPMRIRMQDNELEPGDYLLVLASALQRLLFGCRPYWGQEDAMLRTTAVQYPPRRLLAALPAFMRGQHSQLLCAENGYHSHNVDYLEVTLDGPYIVDGEIYMADAGQGPVRVRATEQPLGFVHV